MTIVQEYLDYTKKYKKEYGEKTLVLMQVGSFFESYALIDTDGKYIGSNIQDFANINDMVISKKNVQHYGKQVVMAGFGLPQLDKYVKKLQSAGYTIVVYTQDNQTKNTTRSLYSIYSPGTFFNNYDNMNDNNMTNNTMSIWLYSYNKIGKNKESEIIIGYSIIDIITGKIIFNQYTRENKIAPSTFDKLEQVVSIYNPSETIIILNNTVCTNSTNNNIIDNIVNYSNIQSIKIHKIIIDKNNDKELLYLKACNCEKQVYQQEFINRIYGYNYYNNNSVFIENLIATQSLCFLLDFVHTHNPDLIKNTDYPFYEYESNKLRFANHSLKQLNIINDSRYSGKLNSVASFLNNCTTIIGKRKFSTTILNPITIIDKLNSIYDITDYLITTQQYQYYRDKLVDIKDFEKLERKCVLKTINPREFSLMYDSLVIIKDIYNTLTKDSSLLSFVKQNIDQDICTSCLELIRFIENNFNIEKSRQIYIDKLQNYNIENLDFFNMSNNSDIETLFKTSIDATEQIIAIQKYLCKLLHEYEKPKTRTQKKTINNDNNNNNNNDDNDDYNYVKIHETGKTDIMLIMTKRRCVILQQIIEKLIKNNNGVFNIEYISKYSGNHEYVNLDLKSCEFKQHGNNQTNMLITSPLIYKIANNINNSKDVLITKIVQRYNIILDKFISFNDTKKIKTIVEFIGLIDITQTRCYNAEKYNYCKPIIKSNSTDNSINSTEYIKSFVDFEKLRHPLIEHLNNDELYVTNCLSMGLDNTGLLLYGTNAVGKTSFIKSVGIAIVMAQSGMFVPASKFTYYPYTSLFTRILGNDNIFKGLSTFAVEMSELRTIIHEADNSSLIIGDELCSGTESTSALSIFVASLEHLHNISSTFLFATHFHEILEYQEVKQLNKMSICHMAVVYDKEKDCLIYDRKLKPGPGNAMYGLEVCKSLNLPDYFIDRAYSLREKYGKNKSVLESKTTRYNNKKLRGTCEICKSNQGTEVHHLQYQKNADKSGIINQEFSKNKKANLINICDVCHDKIHSENVEYRLTKTTQGYTLVSV